MHHGDQAAAPHLRLRRVQQQAEAAAVAARVAAAAPRHRPPDVAAAGGGAPRHLREGGARGGAVGCVRAAVEGVAGAGLEHGGVDGEQLTRGARQLQLPAVAAWRGGGEAQV